MRADIMPNHAEDNRSTA